MMLFHKAFRAGGDGPRVGLSLPWGFLVTCPCNCIYSFALYWCRNAICSIKRERLLEEKCQGLLRIMVVAYFYV